MSRSAATTHPGSPTPGRYRIEPALGGGRLSVSHLLGLGTVHASLDVSGGAADITEDVTATRIEVRLDATSFTSGSRRRDHDVQGRGVLDTGRWPDITFTTDHVEPTAIGWRAHGTLTAHGVPAPLTVEATATPTDQGFRLHARATVDRAAHGVAGKPGMVGRRIGIEIAVEVRRTPPTDHC